ncbi:hypothetical protein PG999_008497 [Apiospora kogelbergensis]|uniref:Uncharacterized protein n=1 Tax=Apiospora kogelbergensis TaxID=1337665 RepID=A0AAW0QIT2_9PEZI
MNYGASSTLTNQKTESVILAILKEALTSQTAELKSEIDTIPCSLRVGPSLIDEGFKVALLTFPSLYSNRFERLPVTTWPEFFVQEFLKILEGPRVDAFPT